MPFNCSGITIKRDDIKCTLFDPLVPLLKQLGLNICNFNKWGVEDLYFSFYWRHAYVLNYNRDLSWARALVIPFLRVGASAPAGRAKEQDFFFSLPFGNNGSASVDINAGMNFDFSETVEIGASLATAISLKKILITSAHLPITCRAVFFPLPHRQAYNRAILPMLPANWQPITL